MTKKGSVVDAHVDSLIVLWHILFDPSDLWHQYVQRLNEYQGLKDNYYKIDALRPFSEAAERLQSIHDGKNVKGSRKIKKFYKDHQSVLDIICQYSSIKNFTNYNFDWNRKLKDSSGLDFFYGYFTNHEDEAEKILAVLERLKQLGLQELHLEEGKDFTTGIYRMNTRNSLISDIEILDNMELVPNYEDDVVTYRTTGSNYEIREGGMWGNSVTVNNLTFDPERLPKSMARNELYYQIIDLKNSHQQECDSLRDSIDLSVAIDDLSSQVNIASQVVERLKSVHNKDELHQLLLQIKEHLEQLHTISTQYDSEISQSSSLITEEKLQSEKTNYLRRRKYNTDTH